MTTPQPVAPMATTQPPTNAPDDAKPTLDDETTTLDRQLDELEAAPVTPYVTPPAVGTAESRPPLPTSYDEQKDNPCLFPKQRFALISWASATTTRPSSDAGGVLRVWCTVKTVEDAKKAQARIRELNRYARHWDIWVVRLGGWLPFPPTCDDPAKNVYQEKALNDIMNARFSNERTARARMDEARASRAAAAAAPPPPPPPADEVTATVDRMRNEHRNRSLRELIDAKPDADVMWLDEQLAARMAAVRFDVGTDENGDTCVTQSAAADPPVVVAPPLDDARAAYLDESAQAPAALVEVKQAMAANSQ